MQLSKEKIELLRKKLPELYEFVLNVTSLLEGNLSYVKNISADEIQKLNDHDPSSVEIESRLTEIQSRADAILDKLKESIRDCNSFLGTITPASLANILVSKEFNESLTFNEKFIASAVAAAIAKVKYE